MPRFFIDTLDQEAFLRDDDGADYADLGAAKAAAIGALPDMARDELPDGDARTFTATIRNIEGHVLLKATLSLSVTSPASTNTTGNLPKQADL